MFKVEEVALELPEEARILPSILCDNCGEPVMATRVVEAGGRKLCIPCSEGRR
jgi:formylmethanofuran dehydrogenase subunit E